VVPAEHGPDPGKPRQLLVIGIAAGGASDVLQLVAASPDEIAARRECAACTTPDPAWAGPTWSTAIVHEKKTGLMMREANELVLEHDGRHLGIRLGIEMSGGGFHWWEWVQVEQLWAGPVCTAVRAAGYIGVTELAEDELSDPQRYNSGKWLHRHNWLIGEVYLQIFANGLVRATARHVNNRFVDQGRDLEMTAVRAQLLAVSSIFS